MSLLSSYLNTLTHIFICEFRAVTEKKYVVGGDFLFPIYASGFHRKRGLPLYIRCRCVTWRLSCSRSERQSSSVWSWTKTLPSLSLRTPALSQSTRRSTPGSTHCSCWWGWCRYHGLQGGGPLISISAPVLLRRRRRLSVSSSPPTVHQRNIFQF